MGIVTYKPGRGRVVMKRQVNINPRNGMTMRMLMKASAEIKITLKNMYTLRILGMKEGRVRAVSGPNKGKLHRALKFVVRDSERTTPRDPIKRHNVLVYLKEPIEVTDAKGQAPWLFSGKNVNVIVSCTCENHMYMWEYALTHFSASFIKYGNGDPPLVTNPALIPACCKHLNYVFNHIMKKGW